MIFKLRFVLFLFNAAHVSYLGPKLYVKPSSKSNRHIMQNAIGHCCLAGIVNNDIKNKVLDVSMILDVSHDP